MNEHRPDLSPERPAPPNVCNAGQVDWDADDTPLLYELSLTVGDSLDPRAACRTFLHRLMERRGFDYAAIWVLDAYLPGTVDEHGSSLLCALPETVETPRRLERTHVQYALVETKPFFCLPAKDAPELYERVTVERGLPKGGWVIYPLGSLGVLKLHAPACPDRLPVEACARMLPVVQKLTTALGNALAHARLEHQSRVREETERALRASEERIRRLEKMDSLGAMAGGVAHDFNNILAAILGNASVLARKLGPNHALSPYVDAIRKSAEHAAELTSQLLAFARPTPHSAQPVDLNRLIENVIEILDLRSNEQLRVQTRLDPHLPPLIGEPTQIQQILLNLFINARDAMPEGGTLTIETALESRSEQESDEGEHAPPRYVALRVRDTGRGLEPGTRDRIFEPFFTTKPAGEGTGLGLALVYAAVKSHDGRIDVESEPGKGTTFTVHFPLRGEDAAREQNTPRDTKETNKKEASGQTLPARAPSGPPHPSARPEHRGVLVADDDEAIRLLVRELLEEEGYRVFQAADGVEACEMLERHKGEIDLVLLDMLMPRLSGLEALARLRRTDPSVRILLSTGYSHEDAVDRALALGAVGFIPKPYRVEELLEAIERAFAAPLPPSDDADRAAAAQRCPSDRSGLGSKPPAASALLGEPSRTDGEHPVGVRGD